MKFKLDENLPLELVTDLRDLGHDGDTVIDEGLRGVADPAVVQAAFACDRILLTLDKGGRECPTIPGSRSHRVWRAVQNYTGRLARNEFLSSE